MNDNWELGAGARFSHEKQNSNDYFRKGKGESNYNNNAVFNAFIPRASIAWLPNEQNRIWFELAAVLNLVVLTKKGLINQL
ncbi:hypothetical protein WBU87_27025 [Escherichia coli]